MEQRHTRLAPLGLEASAGRVGFLVLLPTAALLLLAIAAIGREGGTLRPLETTLSLAGLLCLALLVRVLAADGSRAWWALLFAGAVALRVLFALKWTVWPHGDYLTGWNLALELSRTGPEQWRSLTAASGVDGGLAAYAVYESLMVRLFGPALVAVQVPNAVLSGAGCMLTGLVGERLTGSHLTGLTAGVLLACCPTQLFAAGLLSWVPLYTVLLLAGVWLLLGASTDRGKVNWGLSGVCFGLCQTLRPGLPVPLLAVWIWVLLTLVKEWKRRTVLLHAAILTAGFLLTAGVAGGLFGWLAGSSPIRSLPTMEELVEGVRLQLTSYNYIWVRLDQGSQMRQHVIDVWMHPVLQSYMWGVLLLALAGILTAFKGICRTWLLICTLLLAGTVGAVLSGSDPVSNGTLIPFLALWAAAPAVRLAQWVQQMAAPEGKKHAPPMPLALRGVRLAVSVAVYAAMLALVLIFFTGNGVFVYEAF